MEVVKDKDGIVISGISGRFPESNNKQEFMENLLGNKNMTIGKTGIGYVSVDISNPDDAFLVFHTIEGCVLYPATGYIYMIWKQFALMKTTPMNQLPVVFEKVKIQRVILLRQNEITGFFINISDASGYFEVTENDAVACCGTIRTARENEEKLIISEVENQEILNQSGGLTRNEVYTKFRLLGYEYQGLFKGINSSNLIGTNFEIQWNDNWIGFLDTFLQSYLRVYSEKELFTDLKVPTEIPKFFIDPIKFYENIDLTAKSAVLSVQYNPFTKISRSKGVELEGLKLASLSKIIKAEISPSISNYAFEPYDYREAGLELTAEDYSPLLRSVAIVMENMDFVYDKTVYRKPNILEISVDASTNETFEVNKTIRDHFSVQKINYTFCTENLSSVQERLFKKANICTRTTENPDWQNSKWDLIVVDNPFWFDTCLNCVQTGGFILIKLAKGHTHCGNIDKTLPTNFQLISHKVSESCEVILIRKLFQENWKKTKHFINVELNDLSWVKKAQDLIIRQKELSINGLTEEELPFLYFISNGIPLSGIQGFIRCLRKEPYGSQIRCIFSMNHIPLNLEKPENDPILKVILEKSLVFNVFNENKTYGSYIHTQVNTTTKVSSSSSVVNIEIPGDLSTFNWIQGFEFSKHIDSLPETHVPVKVYNTALNFKDIMIATRNLAPEYISKYPTLNESPIGLEFSGIVEQPNSIGSKPRRVCGFTSARCLATEVFIEKDYLIDIPNEWTFEEAATVPAVYSTAYFALVIRGNIQRNSSILIHSGAGGVGIAAIRIALSYNCQIFTTVSSESKIEFITKTFPEIPVFNIGYSRDTRFEQLVRNGTDGYGVDLVLNSLTGEKLEASLRCLAPHGQFLEIGRVDMSRNTPIGSDALLNDVGFHSIFLAGIQDGSKSGINIWKQIKLLLLEGISSGVVVPLPYRLFNKNQIEPAFRFMGQGVYIGKVVISVREKQEEEIPLKVPSTPRTYFNPDKIYIIIAGLSGVGQELINWMTLRYARKIIITSRTGSSNLRGYTRSYLNLWKERGVRVEIYKFEPWDNLEPLFNFATNKLGDKLGGIFNLAMYLEHGIFTELTTNSFQRSLTPKIFLTKKLDEYSRKKDLNFDYFVVFSSISSAMGHHGLTCYGLASASMERVIETRRKDGLPGTAIQFGPIGDVGTWHENFNTDYSRSSFLGSGIQSIRSVIKSLDLLLANDNPFLTPILFCRQPIEVSERRDGTNLLEVKTNVF